MPCKGTVISAVWYTNLQGWFRVNLDFHSPQRRYDHKKIKTLLWTVGCSIALMAWLVAMHPTSVYYSQYKMLSDFVIRSVEQCCVNIFVVKEEVKP